MIKELIEKMHRPGLLGVVGKAAEAQCRRDLEGYFQLLKKRVMDLKLEELVLTGQTPDMVRHAVKAKLHNVLRLLRPNLVAILAVNYMHALMKGSKQNVFSEVDPSGISPVDILGGSGQSAADWAANMAAELVQGIDTTTQDSIADIIAEGIEGMRGVPGTASDLQDLMDGMTRKRALTIASTEMNRAFSAAALDKFNAVGVEYKQIILSEDACDICEGNADQDPIPVDEEYDSGDLAPPFHPNCRCAITGARPPEGEDDSED